MRRAWERFNKPLWLAVAAQLACLSVGLWIHHRYVLSSLNRASEHQAWSELETLARDAAAELDRAAQSSPRIDKTVATVEQIALVLRRQAADRLLLVDEDFRLSATGGADGDDSPLAWSAAAGATDDQEKRATQQSPGRMIRGDVDFDGQRHLALARPMVTEKGYLLALRPSIALKASAEMITGPLVYASLITFVWTGGVMGFALYLILGRLHDNLWRTKQESEAFALKRTEAMLRMREAVIFGLAKLTESRDPATGYHLERISLYSARLATALRRVPKYRHHVTPDFIQLIGTSSSLHDIGKVGVEDAVLLKPGAFDEDERRRMQEHAAIGGKCLQDIERRLGSSNFLQMAREIAFSHHEHWDGGGYPNGLAAEKIPLAARIVAIADVYEALSTKRVYKEAMPHDECIGYIRDQAGKQFDPELVDAFLSIETQIRRIALEFANEADEGPAEKQRDLEQTGGDGVGDTVPMELLSSAPSADLTISSPDD